MIKQALLGLAFLSLASGANALLIDFTSETWSGVDASGASHTESIAGIGDVTLTAYSAGSSLTFNDLDSGGCNAGGGAGAGLDCVGDGIGIGDDEITSYTEVLRVSFSSPVDVLDILLLDLFSSEPETARIASYGSGGLSTFTVGGSTDVGGLVMTGIAVSGVTNLFFWAQGEYSDYALAGIEVAAVPIPGALVLFLSGLAGFGVLRKRKAATTA